MRETRGGQCTVLKAQGHTTYASLGEPEVDDEGGLEGKVEGEVVEDGAESPAFEEVEAAKDDPVCQPLSVIASRRALDRLEREVCRYSPAEEVGDGQGEGVDEEEKNEECTGAEDSEGLGHLGALLKVVERRILRELYWRR